MRKLAAIMFTDIVGYSTIMSRDESLALIVLEKNRQILRGALNEHNGEFIKEIGDGTLCIFQSSWDAVNCAIAIQKSMMAESSFRLRIGIHIGDIVMTENDVFGDGVNIASRLESICEPGGICFTQRVYEDVQNKLDLNVTLTGEKSLKNIAQSVITYSIPAAEFSQTNSFHPVDGHVNTAPVPKKNIFFRKSKAAFIISIVLGLIFGGYFAFRPLVLKALVQNDPIPIAVISFENQTGDSTFDYLQKAIPNLLITNLEQSNLFHVITWERMQDILSQMGKTDVKTIDPTLGFEICRMEGCNLIVIGSYIKAGETFVTDVKVLDVNTKQLLKSASARGTGEASILLSQIDDLSKEISGSAGIPYRRIETAGLHVRDVTTSSMAAYDLFLTGREAYDKMYYNDARGYLEEALRMDSTFAVAWLYLSNAYGSLQNVNMRDIAIKKAYQYSSRATENEQLTIKSVYARIIDNNPEEELRLLKELAVKTPKDKRVHYALGIWYCNNGRPDDAITVLKTAIDLDPRYSEPLNQIAYQYMKKGMYDDALRYFRRYAALSPKDANPHDSMGDLLWQMGKLDEAIAEYNHALEIKPDFHVSAGKIAYIYGMKEDYVQAQNWVKRAVSIAPSPGTKAIWHWVDAWMYNWCGKRGQAFNSLEKTYELAAGDNNMYIIAGTKWMKAFMHLDEKAFDSARVNFSKAVDIFLEYSTNPAGDSAAYYNFSAIVSLAEGNTAEAAHDLDQVQRLIPAVDSTSVDFIRYWSAGTRVKLLLAINQAQNAAEQGKITELPELPEFEYPQVLIYNIPMQHDFLAQAYTQLGKESEAIAEYENLVSFDPNEPDRRLIHPMYHYRLAKLYEESGQAGKAITRYRKFLELWRNADPIYTEVPDAQKRLENLERK